MICESKKTRNGFKHEATLLLNGIEKDKTKKCYLNRTWEAFEFDSVIEKLLEETKVLSEREKDIFWKRNDKKNKEEIDKDFRMISNIAKMGEIICDNKKEKNDWKKKMLMAGLENQGLTIPDDWNELNEDEKEKRLDKVIEGLKK